MRVRCVDRVDPLMTSLGSVRYKLSNSIMMKCSCIATGDEKRDESASIDDFYEMRLYRDRRRKRDESASIDERTFSSVVINVIVVQPYQVPSVNLRARVRAGILDNQVHCRNGVNPEHFVDAGIFDIIRLMA